MLSSATECCECFYCSIIQKFQADFKDGNQLEEIFNQVQSCIWTIRTYKEEGPNFVGTANYLRYITLLYNYFKLTSTRRIFKSFSSTLLL